MVFLWRICLVAALGGPADFLERYTEYLPKAAIHKPVQPGDVGYLAGIDTYAIGNAIIEIGGGRQQLGDELDLAVGICDFPQIGEMVGPDRPLGVVHAASEEDADLAAELIREACTISADQPTERPVIYEKLTAE